MQVLALNPGSSSLRFQLLAADARGGALVVERVGGGSIAGIARADGASARTRHGPGAEPRVERIDARDHVEALEWALGWIERCGTYDVAAVRLVHVGGTLGGTRELGAHELAELRARADLAPAHSTVALHVVGRLHELLGARATVLTVSDSAFHATLPPVARRYALPEALAERHGIERFGYHGLAVRSVVARFAAAEPAVRRLVVLHLGGGCSATAVRDGRSLDTSMGFTPLEGLVMPTRAGDLDPAVVTWLCRGAGLTSAEVLAELNDRSGLLGVDGRSSDMREIERRRAAGDARAALAFDLFVHRAKKHLAGMLAVLGGADAVLLSGGIGENSAAVRAALLADMDWCGCALAAARNAAPERPCGRVSRDGARLAAWVVGADEEEWLAREAHAYLTRGGATR